MSKGWQDKLGEGPCPRCNKPIKYVRIYAHMRSIKCNSCVPEEDWETKFKELEDKRNELKQTYKSNVHKKKKPVIKSDEIKSDEKKLYQISLTDDEFEKLSKKVRDKLSLITISTDDKTESEDNNTE